MTYSYSVSYRIVAFLSSYCYWPVMSQFDYFDLMSVNFTAVANVSFHRSYAVHSKMQIDSASLSATDQA